MLDVDLFTYRDEWEGKALTSRPPSHLPELGQSTKSSATPPPCTGQRGPLAGSPCPPPATHWGWASSAFTGLGRAVLAPSPA